MGPNPGGLVALEEEDEKVISVAPHAHIEERPCQHTMGSQGESSHQNQTTQAWSWTCSFQGCEKVNFCCLHHPVCGILVWQPEQIKTVCVCVYVCLSGGARRAS